jgi:hypothetical protein
MSTIAPTQVGYIPPPPSGTAGTSTYVVGRMVSGSYEGVGLGAGGRPDYVQVIQFNLAQRGSDGALSQKGTVTMNANDLVAIAGLPTNLNLTLREVDVCDNGVARKLVILASEPY